MIKYICENCDSEVLYDAVFCNSCGSKFVLNDGLSNILTSLDELVRELKIEKKQTNLN